MIQLRKLIKDDATKLAELLNNRNIIDQLRDIIPYPYGVRDAVSFINFVNEDNSQHVFGIEHNGELVGVVGLVQQADIYKLSAELGYWLGEEYWGRGIMVKAVAKLIDYGFAEMGLVRIFAGAKENNRRSQRVLEKAGFILEGIARSAVIKNGVVQDEHRYAIVNSNI